MSSGPVRDPDELGVARVAEQAVSETDEEDAACDLLEQRRCAELGR